MGILAGAKVRAEVNKKALPGPNGPMVLRPNLESHSKSFKRSCGELRTSRLNDQTPCAQKYKKQTKPVAEVFNTLQ